MADMLHVPCRVIPQEDYLELWATSLDANDSEPRIDVHVLDSDVSSGRPAKMTLNEAGAREVFNWLGVWLHGGNRTTT